ncbi:MAG: VanZ family protein [Sphaerochaetaceae bacterium]|nr:VanZ family protein [Sphaerochaetaceae bacterium]
MEKVIRIIGITMVIILLVVIAFLSLKKVIEIPMGIDVTYGHCLAYVALSFSIYLSCCKIEKNRFLIRNFKRAFLCMLLSFFWGYLMEVIQPYFGRTYEIKDLVADFLGSFFGVFIGIVCVSFVKIIEEKYKIRHL